MADYFINVFLDEAKKAVITEAGLTDSITSIDGKEAIQVGMTQKGTEKVVQGVFGSCF